MCNVIKKRCVFFLLGFMSNTYFPTDELPQAAGGTAKSQNSLLICSRNELFAQYFKGGKN